MSWHAKPSGSYPYNQQEGLDNVWMIYYFFHDIGYTTEAIAGIIGNVIAESGLNPWRWQNDTVNMARGYGLFQWTPASGYINGATSITGHSPNLSVTEVDGGNVSDAQAQLVCFSTDFLNKWVNTAWPSYWDKNTYADLWQMTQTFLRDYGTNNRLSIYQFSQLPYVNYATQAFLGCFEQPGVPNFSTRYQFAQAIYEILTGSPPPEPPTPTQRRKMPIWMYLRYY